MIYKSVIDFPSESESIDESCFDFIRDVSIDSLHPLEFLLRTLHLLKGPCTFPQFNFSYFYLYTEGLLGSIVNVARDRIQFVA